MKVIVRFGLIKFNGNSFSYKIILKQNSLTSSSFHLTNSSINFYFYQLNNPNIHPQYISKYPSYKMTSKPSLITRILQTIDVFSYIPVPQAYPVSTKKSKIGSIVFLLALIGYLAFDFYKFVTDNVPIINAYDTDIINKGASPVPSVAFGMYFKQTIGNTTQTFMFNNTAYFSYKFESYLTTLYPNKTSTEVAVTIPLIPCQNDEINNWTRSWYSNLTCVDVNSPVINGYNLSYKVVDEKGNLLVDDQVVDGVAYSYYLRLLIYVCKNGTTANVTCASTTEINNFFKNSTLYFLGAQPVRYDFKAGAPLGAGITAITYRYSVTTTSTTTSSLYVYPTQFQTYANYLTTFRTNITRYSRYGRDYTTSTSLGSYVYRVRIWPEWAMEIVENHPVTLFVKLSEWSAFAGLILFIGGICFLTYNKSKFSKRNPDWEKFDETLKEKVYIELQNVTQKVKERDEESQREGGEPDGVSESKDHDKDEQQGQEESEYEGNITSIRRKIVAGQQK